MTQKEQIREVIIVEGRDDTAAVRRALDAETIETHGFGMSEEMWARMGKETLVLNEPWPQGDAKLAEDNVVTLAVQICGKMRGTIEMPKDAPQADVEQKALSLENVARQLEGRQIRKIIVVPNRIVNIVA